MEPEYILNTVAEDINLGVCCALCGRPFVQMVGYPCVCWDCYDRLNAEEREHYDVNYFDAR